MARATTTKKAKTKKSTHGGAREGSGRARVIEGSFRRYTVDVPLELEAHILDSKSKVAPWLRNAGQEKMEFEKSEQKKKKKMATL